VGAFEIAVSVPLVLEYEDAMLRHAAAAGLTDADVQDIVDYLCSVAVRQEIFYLWRPSLRDAGDDLVLRSLSPPDATRSSRTTSATFVVSIDLA
jgi:hypothetical protein